MAGRKPERSARSGPESLRTRRRRQREALRDEMLDVAASIIASGGTEALSMRKLAAALDCAPMSLYSYFRAKHDLLLALAQRSFEALALRFASTPDDSPLDGLRNLHLSYACFGLDHADEYRILFMTPETHLPRARKGPETMVAENPAFAISFRRVQACVEVGHLHGDPHAIATLLWTAVHGAVSALLTFPAFPFGDAVTYTTRAVDLAIAALRGMEVKPLA